MVIRKRAGVCSEPWVEDEFTEEGVPGRQDSPSNGSGMEGSGGVWGHGQTVWAWNARSKGLILLPGCKVKVSGVHDTSVVLSSGHMLHGDSKSRWKHCC